jgi:hypothetical protein
MGTIGFGTASEYSRMRIPSPPQNNTTFIYQTGLMFDADFEINSDRHSKSL